MSELISTLIMVAITLVAGAAVFGFVNGQAANSEKGYANSAAANINYLNEHFTIVNVQFPSSCNVALNSSGGTCDTVLVSVYNTGSVYLTVSGITITGGTLDAVATQSGVLDYSNGSPISGCSESQTDSPTPFSYTFASATTSLGTVSTVIETNTGTTAVAIPTSVVPPALFTVVLPTGSGCPQFNAGTSYEIQVQGLYGNVASYQITASG